jgi:hypothetical protein
MFWAATTFISTYKNGSSEVSYLQKDTTWTGTWNSSDLVTLTVTSTTNPITIKFKQACKVFGTKYDASGSGSPTSLTGNYAANATINFRDSSNDYSQIFVYID